MICLYMSILHMSILNHIFIRTYYSIYILSITVSHLHGSGTLNVSKNLLGCYVVTAVRHDSSNMLSPYEVRQYTQNFCDIRWISIWFSAISQCFTVFHTIKSRGLKFLAVLHGIHPGSGEETTFLSIRHSVTAMGLCKRLPAPFAIHLFPSNP